MIADKIKELFALKNILNQELVEYILIYLRKSRKDSEFGKDESIERTLKRHEDILQDWAKNVFGCKIPEKNIFREIVSGDTIADRPKMQKVLELVESDKIKGVLCIEIERLARGNTIDQGTIAQKFQITNTKILTPNKIFDLDDEYDMSYFEDGLHQARKYLQYTKKILARGREQSIKEGKYPISTPLFGYDKRKLEKEKGYTLVPNEDSKTVRKIFEMYLYDNLGTQNIAKKLNLLNLKSPSLSPWTDSMVRSRLDKAEIYAGYVVWNKRKTVKKYLNGAIKLTRPISKNYLKIEGKHPPIITQEEYNLIELKKKKLAIKKNINSFDLQNPLAGLIKCAFCGKNMSRRPHNHSNVKGNIGHQDTLLCRTSNCPNVSSNLNIVEQKILIDLKKKLKDYKNMLQDYSLKKDKKPKQNVEERKAVIKKIDELKKQESKCCEFLEKGTYDEDMFKLRIDVLNKELEIAESSLKEIEAKIKNEQLENYQESIPILEKCLNLYTLVDAKLQNELLCSIIAVVYYQKTNKTGRWQEEARDDFTLKYVFKI